MHRSSFVIALVLAACGGKQSPPPPSNAAPAAVPVDAAPAQTENGVALSKMSSYAEQMCACTDKPCADKVQEDLTRWGSDMAKKESPGHRPPPMTEAEMKQGTEIGERYASCMAKAMGAGPTP